MRPLRLLLVGGGHAHLAVLELFARHPRRDVELTLISAEAATFYSGMVPGLIAGHYTAEEAQIPLAPLAAAANAVFLYDEVTGLDLAAKRARRGGGAAIDFDLVSIDVGSTPAREGIAIDGGRLVPVKPVAGLLAQWHEVSAEAQRRTLAVAVIGGGLGGIELGLAMAHRLRAFGGSASLRLITREPVIAASISDRARGFLLRALRAADVEIHTGFAAERITRKAVYGSEGRHVAADIVFLASHAKSAPWLRASGIAVDENGFPSVHESLQSCSHPFVFLAGDTASFSAKPLPKSGVVAVRQGATLAHNVWAMIDRAPLARYRPQKNWLALVGTGDAHAVAMRGGFAAEGKLFWRLKQAIDLRFVARYRSL